MIAMQNDTQAASIKVEPCQVCNMTTQTTNAKGPDKGMLTSTNGGFISVLIVASSKIHGGISKGMLSMHKQP